MQEIILTPPEIAELLPRRPKNVHKGNLGKVLVIAGSRGMTGAAILSSKAVMRAGAGLTTLATPAFLVDFIDVQNLEVMTLPLHQTELGNISAKAVGPVSNIIAKFDTLLIGPGISACKSSQKFALDLIKYISDQVPTMRVLIDADGLKVLRKIVRPLSMPTIITPHFGELAYILERSVAEIKKRPVHFALQAANRFNVTVVLKGAQTDIVEPAKKRYFLCDYGNPGMATAGSGDVLAGVITGLWVANKISPVKAAICGVYLHGQAGNIAADIKSLDGMLASDILEAFPQASRGLRGS